MEKEDGERLHGCGCHEHDPSPYTEDVEEVDKREREYVSILEYVSLAIQQGAGGESEMKRPCEADKKQPDPLILARIEKQREEVVHDNYDDGV